MSPTVMTTVCFKCGNVFMPDAFSCGEDAFSCGKCATKPTVMASFKQSSAPNGGPPIQHMATPGTSKCLDRPKIRRKERQKMKKKMFKAAERANALQLTDAAENAAAFQLTDEHIQLALFATADTSSDVAAPSLFLHYMAPEEQSYRKAYHCQAGAQSRSEMKAPPSTIQVRVKNTFLEFDTCNDDDDDQFNCFGRSRSTGRSSFRSSSVPRKCCW